MSVYRTIGPLVLGMSFGVRFKVWTFGNKHHFSDQVIIRVHVHLHVCLSFAPLKEHSKSRVTEIGFVSVDVSQTKTQFRKIHLHSLK